MPLIAGSCTIMMTMMTLYSAEDDDDDDDDFVEGVVH